MTTYRSPHATRAHKQRKDREADHTIIKGTRPAVGTRVSTDVETSHLGHRVDQTMKPSRSSTDRTDISNTYLMTHATDGKISGTDHDHKVDEGFGWKQGEFKESGLANNVYTTAELSTHPESTLGGGTDVHQAPPESAHPRLTPMKTVSKMVWNYKPAMWC